MFYNYTCNNNCKVSQLSEEQLSKLVIEEHPEQILIWTEKHLMDETPDIRCPVCNSQAKKTWHGINQTFYFPGNCYLNRDDCQRQMDLRLLESGNDPYSHMRQPGEKDELIGRLKKRKTPKA